MIQPRFNEVTNWMRMNKMIRPFASALEDTAMLSKAVAGANALNKTVGLSAANIEKPKSLSIVEEICNKENERVKCIALL